MDTDNSLKNFSNKIGIRLKPQIDVHKHNVYAYTMFGIIVVLCLLIAYMDSIHWVIQLA